MAIINYVTAPDHHHGQVRIGDRGMIRRPRARRHGDRNNTTVISDASWKYDVTLLRNMTYRIRGSKIDQQRRGVTMFFEVTDENDPDVTFCDVKDAFRWARETQPSYGRRRVSLMSQHLGIRVRSIQRSIQTHGSSP